MAKYDNNVAHAVWRNWLVEAKDNLDSFDLTLLDMIGYFAWVGIQKFVSEDEESNAQKILLASIIAAYTAGKDLIDGDEIPEDFKEFIDSMDINLGIKSLEEAMNW